jgi:hypothetical protein
MEMNRDYLHILRVLRTMKMSANKRLEAQREVRRAVLIAQVLARAMNGRGWGGGRLVPRVIARLRGFSRARRHTQAA